MQHWGEWMDGGVDGAARMEAWNGGPADKLVSYQNGTVWNVWEFYALCPEAWRYTRHPAILRLLEETLGEPVIHASVGTSFDNVS